MPKLWDHQRRMLDFANVGSAEDFSLFYAGLSTGKTLFGLEFLRPFKGLRLVVAPANALPVWKADYEGFYDDPEFGLYVFDRGSSKDKEGLIRTLQQQRANAIVVLSYDTAARIDFTGIHFDAVVADEAHRFGQHNGAQSMYIAKALVDTPYKVAMTGTPYHDGYEKLYGITRYLDCFIPSARSAHPQSRLFGHYNDFLDNYCTTYTKGYTRIITGYKHIDRLAAKIKPFTMVIRTEDVHNLPPFTERVYKVALGTKLQRVYNSIADEGAVIHEGKSILAPHVLTRTVRLQQLASAGLLVAQDGSETHFDITPRLNMFSSIVEGLDDEPYVVFTKYDREVELVTQRLSEMGVSYGVLTGTQNDYQNWRDGGSRVLVANLSAGSEGVRLERAAHTIMWSVGYSYKEFVQAKGRTRRVGQKSNTVQYHYIVAEGTIDEELYKVLHAKSLEVNELDEYLV